MDAGTSCVYYLGMTTTCAACTATGRCLACRLTHAMDMVDAAKVTQGTTNRVQFEHRGETLTGIVIGYGRLTRPRIGTVDFILDIRHNRDEARRYRMSEVTGMRPAPLTGTLPECAKFQGTGRRCAECHIHANVHA
jgi:hypothetical protein